MIRKAIIVALTLAALVTAGLGMRCYILPNPSQHKVDFGFPRSAQYGPRDWQIWITLVEGNVYVGGRRWNAPPQTPWHQGVSDYRRPFGYLLRVCAAPTMSSPVVFIRYWKIWAPSWAVAMVLAIYPTIAFVRGPLRRRRRRRRGLCVTCSYDLTGNTSGVCPECAMKVAG